MEPFSRLNPLEYMAVADENVYSALLCWLLGADSPLPAVSRARVLERLTGQALPGCTSTTASTEWKDLNLVVDVTLASGTCRIAFENKVKAKEGKGQLGRYDLLLLEGATKVLLTFVGDAPASGAGSIAATYGDLASALSAEAPSCTASRHYVDDYLAMIHRLSRAVALVATDPAGYARFVFGQGPSPSEPFRRYVETLKLQRFLQCVWLRRVGDVARVVAFPGGHALSTEWEAFTKPERAGALHEVEVRSFAQGIFGLQLQGGALKFYGKPHGYPNATAPGADARVLAVLLALRPSLGADLADAPTKDRGKGFRSFVSPRRVTTWDTQAAGDAVGEHLGRLVRAVGAVEEAGALTRVQAAPA